MISASEEMGFDCRIWDVHNPPLWDSARRATFLLDPSIRRPLAIDLLVWPSVFDWGTSPSGLPHPEFVGRHAPFWTDLGELHGEILKLQPPSQYVILQAFAWSTGTSAAPLAPGFHFLGYDVADEGFVSAMSNCGLTEAEWRPLRSRFQVALNTHHLFIRWESAMEYCQAVSELIPEHAPFYPYLLAWRSDRE